MSYDIITDIIPNLPSFPYRNGWGAYEGVVAHCTDSDNHSGGDIPDAERNYEARTYNSAFVHFFVGWENGAILIKKVAPVNSGAYGAGTFANHRFVHVEMCMYDDPEIFQQVYNAYCWLLAYILYQRQLGVSPATRQGTGTLWGHFEVSQWLGETNHDDPSQYLEDHGISWDEFRADVAQQYAILATPVTSANIDREVTANLNVHSGPDLSFPVIDVIPDNTKIHIDELTGCFAHTTYEQGGWVSRKYLRIPTSN